MKTYRAGVIGVGGVSSLHTDAYMALPSTELVAAADVSEAALARFTDKYGITNFVLILRGIAKSKHLMFIPTIEGCWIKRT